MASHESAFAPAEPPPQSFGAWLRQRRMSRGVIQRALAAAADMDSSHLGKVERDERLPTMDQALAFARYLDLDEAEVRRRFVAGKFLRECRGDAVLAHAAAGLVQEQAAPYLVNNPTNKK